MAKITLKKSPTNNTPTNNPHLLSYSLVNYLRNQEGMTLKEIGQLIGVGESFVCLVANGKRNFTTDHISKLEKALGEPLVVILLKITPLSSIPAELRPTFRKIFKVMKEG